MQYRLAGVCPVLRNYLTQNVLKAQPNDLRYQMADYHRCKDIPHDLPLGSSGLTQPIRRLHAS